MTQQLDPSQATNPPFGKSYLLDCYACKKGACDDLEMHYRFLEGLVERIGMTPMTPPIVIHAPTKNGVELYPDKAGVSGWIGLITSGIQIHSTEPANFMALDLFSCKDFDHKEVRRLAHELFGFNMYFDNVIERGPNYPYGYPCLKP